MDIPFKDFLTYNPNKGCKYLTQSREGVEKARKENHFKKAKTVTLCVFPGFS